MKTLRECFARTRLTTAKSDVVAAQAKIRYLKKQVQRAQAHAAVFKTTPCSQSEYLIYYLQGLISERHTAKFAARAAYLWRAYQAGKPHISTLRGVEAPNSKIPKEVMKILLAKTHASFWPELLQWIKTPYELSAVDQQSLDLVMSSPHSRRVSSSV